MAKGAGMIEPMMAAMLGFVTCDARVASPLLHQALTAATADTFNAITVDGECSTNDCVFALASGQSSIEIKPRAYIRRWWRDCGPCAGIWRWKLSAAEKGPRSW